MEVQAPLNLTCGPLFRMWYSFSKPVFGDPNVGRNTDLQLKSEHSLNFKCSGNSGH